MLLNCKTKYFILFKNFFLFPERDVCWSGDLFPFHERLLSSSKSQSGFLILLKLWNMLSTKKLIFPSLLEDDFLLTGLQFTQLVNLFTCLIYNSYLQTIYSELQLIGFNLMFSALPIISYGLFEQHLPPTLLYEKPSLYKYV